MEDYEQLKVAVQDLCIELDLTPSDIQSIATGVDYSDDHIGGIITTKTAHKLINAGLLDDPLKRGRKVVPVVEDKL